MGELIGGKDDLLRGLGLDGWSSADGSRPQGDADAEARTAFNRKQGIAGWRAALHVGVQADGRRRQRQILGRMAGAARVAQAPGVQLGFRPTLRSVLRSDRLPTRRPLLVNIDELAGLAGWPIGATDLLPVDHVGSPLLPPAPAVPTGPRVVATATYPGAQRDYALSPQDALQHLHVIGPTGVGKSTLLLNMVCQDIAAGRSVVVIEPTGDLVRDILGRVPDARIDDVVLIDPTDPVAVVGVNPLAAPGQPADLRADHVLAVFKHLWSDSWGPRTQDILTAGLLTLASVSPTMSLAALPLLFGDERFRHQVLDHIHDQIALDPFWSWFHQCKPRERAAVLAPVMNKLRPFLCRPRLRRVIAQPTPRFDMRDVYRQRRIVLVNVAAGALGPESSALLGALVVSQLWQTLLGRSGVPPQRRHPIMIYVDEFQRFLHLPTDLSDVLAQARGLGAGLCLAHQHLAQLEPSMQAVLANARSRVVFATAHEDAAVLVRGDRRLRPADVAALGPVL